MGKEVPATEALVSEMILTMSREKSTFLHEGI